MRTRTRHAQEARGHERTGWTSQRAVDLQDLVKKFRSFGWETLKINGHSSSDLIRALKRKNKKPLMIVCDTIKGKGVSFMEKNQHEWHHKKIAYTDLKKIKKILLDT